MLSVINYYYHYTTSDMTIARGFIHSHTFVKCQTCRLLIVFFFPQRLIKCLHTRERSCHACSHCIANKYSCVKDEKFNNNMCLITSLYSLLFFLLIFSKKRKKKISTSHRGKRSYCVSSLFQCSFFYDHFSFSWPFWWPDDTKNIHVLDTKVSQARTINKYKFVNCAYVNNIYLFFKPFNLHIILNMDEATGSHKMELLFFFSLINSFTPFRTVFLLLALEPWKIYIYILLYSHLLSQRTKLI